MQASSDSSLAGTLKVALIHGASYTYSDSHQFKSDLAGIVGTPVALASKTYTGGVLDADDVVFTALTGSQVDAVVLYIDTGSAGTSRLVAYLDTGFTGIPFTPSGGDLTVAWDNGSSKILAL